jgi:hypothetical protein
MSITRITSIVLIASAVTLAAGTVPGSAARPQPSDLSSASPAASGTLLRSSFVIRDDPSVSEVQPAVAYNPDRQEYLVAFWNDRPGNDDIRAERVSRDGKPLGGVWVAAGAGADRRYPDVVYNHLAREYLVVWAAVDTGGNSYIRAQRLAGANAQPLGAALPIRDAAAAVGLVTYPTVAYSSTDDKYLVVWEDTVLILAPPVRTSIVGQVLDGEIGGPIGSALTISQDPGGQSRRQPDVAYNRHANGYLVVWLQSDSQVWSCLVDGDGPPPSFTPQQINGFCGVDGPPTVAAIPTAPGQYKFLVVWEAVTPSVYEVCGRLVAENGTPHPGGYFDVLWDDYGGPQYALRPDVAGDESGKRYLVAWSSQWGNDDITARIVSYDGEPEGHSRGTSFPGITPDYPAVASGSVGDFLIAFQQQPGGSDGVYGQLWGNRTYLPLVLRNAP